MYITSSGSKLTKEEFEILLRSGEFIPVNTEDGVKLVGDIDKATIMQITDKTSGADSRYNIPKEAPKVPDDVVERAIQDNDIYSEVRQLMLNAQRKQVAYGLEKYPETLNENSWGTVETIEHIIEETVDQLHYLVMLKNKMMRTSMVNQTIHGEHEPVL